MENSEIKKRFEALWTDRKIAEQAWDLIGRYIMPLIGSRFFQPEATEGEMDWRLQNVFDDTAVDGCDNLAASIHGSLTSPAVKWFDMAFGDDEKDKNLQYKQWLDNAVKKTWDTIQDSNFNLEAAEGYLDLCGFGNMFFFQEPKNDLAWDGMVTDSVPLREGYFEEDAEGNILRFYRLYNWRPLAIIDKFGAENVPDSIIAKSNQAASERIEFVMCIYKRKDKENADTSKALTPEDRPYGVKYILRESSELLGKEGGFYERPVSIVRWRRTTGSQWGYGPGLIALSTVLTLNKTMKLVLTAGEKAIDPASLVRRRGLLSSLDLSAGGKTVVKDDNVVQAYESKARFDVSQMSIEDMRMMIRSIFKVDQLELKDSPAMSASEAIIRYELMNRLLGPTMGRLQNDYLDPFVSNTFKMLFRAGEFGELPEGLTSGDVINIQYTGPLARAQKMDETASLERFMGNLSQLAEVYPSVRNVPNIEAIVLEMAENGNINTNLLNDEDTISQLNEKDQQINELMQMLQAAQAAADVDKTEAQARQLAGAA